MHVKKQQLEVEMEQWTGSKLGKDYIKAVYCTPAYLTSMQSTSRDAGLGGYSQHAWRQVSLSPVLPGSPTSIIQGDLEPEAILHQHPKGWPCGLQPERFTLMLPV